VVDEGEGEPELHIDGQKFAVHHDKTQGSYHTILLAYRPYSNLTEMAKHLIDRSPTLQTKPPAK
jgi:hypothetical protein